MQQSQGSFSSLYFKTFIKPSASFSSLLDGPYFRYGFQYMLIPCTLYTLMYVMLYLGHGAPSTFTPWLNISKENYYFYNQFLLIPSMIMAWFVSAAYMQILSHSAGGKGTFEQTLALLGLSISVSMWSTLVHDLVMSFLSAMQWIDASQHEIAMNTPTIWRTILWICFAIYFIAFITLFTKTVRVVHQLNKVKSLFIGFTGFVLFQLVFVIFNR
jgi:hypothetical protein